MDLSLVIKDAQIIDGTGRDAFRGDIAIAGDRIVAVGKVDNAGRARLIDAGGRIICPGFIEIHTHYDPQLCCDRTASPAGEHGVTTVVMGNCSISLAPIRSGQGDRVTRLFGRIEDLSPAFFAAAVPYSWSTFEEYLEAMRPGLGPNVGAVVGHSTLRHYVMGEDAQKRRASDDEIAAMQTVLSRAAANGAFGLSMAYDHIHDENDHPVASAFADLRERLSLAQALAASGRKFLQCNIHPIDEARRMRQIEELATISARTGVACSALGIMDNPVTPGGWKKELEMIAEMSRSGAQLYMEAPVRPADLTFQLSKAWLLAFYMPSWAKIMLSPVPHRVFAFGDRRLRAALADEAQAFAELLRQTGVREVRSPTNTRYLGRKLGEISVEENKSVTDALLDISLADDLETAFEWKDVIHADTEVVGMMLDHPLVKIGASDAGAHVSQMAGEGDTTYLLEHFVRRNKRLTLERAIQRITSELARDFNISGRGVIAPGYWADITVFDPDTIARGPEILLHDLPGGIPRYIRRASGIDLVIVNGTVFVEHGEYTGARAGRFV